MKDTHDKEWIVQREIVENEELCEVIVSANGWEFSVPKTYKDQLRREAKKELLDDIEPIIEEIRNLVPHIENSKHWKDYERLRAKTLGEQVK